MTEENRDKQGANKAFIENQWKPGQSGNPKGRPLGVKYISEYLQELLPLDCGDGTGRTWGQKIAEEWIKQAADTKARGNVPARDEVLDRTEGKVPDTHKIESDVPINIVYKQVGDATIKEEG